MLTRPNCEVLDMGVARPPEALERVRRCRRRGRRRHHIGRRLGRRGRLRQAVGQAGRDPVLKIARSRAVPCLRASAARTFRPAGQLVAGMVTFTVRAGRDTHAAAPRGAAANVQGEIERAIRKVLVALSFSAASSRRTAAAATRCAHDRRPGLRHSVVDVAGELFHRPVGDIACAAGISSMFNCSRG